MDEWVVAKLLEQSALMSTFLFEIQHNFFPINNWNFFLVTGCDSSISSSYQVTALFKKKKQLERKKRKENMSFKHWIWHRHRLVWKNWKNTDAQTVVNQTEVFHKHKDGEAKKREGREGKSTEKESIQVFLRTVFIESGCSRFISHYSSVLSLA